MPTVEIQQFVTSGEPVRLISFPSHTLSVLVSLSEHCFFYNLLSSISAATDGRCDEPSQQG